VPQTDDYHLTQLTLVRHGHVHNPQKILYGRLPRFHLSPEGLREAQSVAQALKKSPLAAVFSSPMLRARQTANQILIFHGSLKLQISKLLTEVNTPLEGCASQKVDALGGDVYTGSAPPFEQPQDIVARVRKFAARIRKHCHGRQVVAVTHGDIITFMLLWARGMALSPRYKRNLSVTGISDPYPVTASMTTFIYRTGADDERPEIVYTRPAKILNDP
jgi:broad specificity phosphatase PhoE